MGPRVPAGGALTAAGRAVEGLLVGVGDDGVAEVADVLAPLDRGVSLQRLGSVDTVARKLEKVIEDFDTDLLVLWQGIGPAPIDKMLKSNELLVDKVLPKLGITLEQFKPTLRPEFETPLWTETPPIR
ncbi:MAG: hypothetical protein JWP46_352 [Modestobacter sp.]|nr:hypothetical protein [Modestobacter sp.]